MSEQPKDYMFRITRLLVASTCFAAALAGCASSTPAKSQTGTDAIANKQVRVVPVFVMPNCQSIAGEQRCQWIEPRGYQPSVPAPATDKHAQGIAL